MKPQPPWLACRFDRVPITAAGLPVDLAIRLYAAGFKTVGAVDELVGAYGEEQLRALLGRKDYALVMGSLFAFCQKRLLDQIARDNAARCRWEGAEDVAGLSVAVAYGSALRWAEHAVRTWHYRHCLPSPRTRSLAYVVYLDAAKVGCLFFGRPQAACCYEGELTYGSAADRQAGKASYDRWEVLNLSRVWLSPDVQQGGELCRPGRVPGFTDRKGVFRPAVASAVVGLALARVGFDYLLHRPPVYLDQPYQVRAVLSYCDSRRHRGTLYRASGFRLARRNAEGMETWYTDRVPPLTAEQDRAVRRASDRDGRACRIRSSTTRRATPNLFETAHG